MPFQISNRERHIEQQPKESTMASLPPYVRSLVSRTLTRDTEAVLLDRNGVEKEYEDFPAGTVVYVENTRYERVFDSPTTTHEAQIVTCLIANPETGGFYRYRTTDPQLA